MVGTRELLAVVLGVGVGLFFVAFPDAVVRIQTAGRVPSDRGGEYGEDGDTPQTYRVLVRGVGALTILVGLYIGAGAFGVL
ncbi:hypothetical protein [Halorientalis litorea]|jgi:hypothetical protein|uniref:hypothetical protein n=1 Tax=Halorientalis litorea TaxID=2931977 RepID=UPI001FF1C1C7|nr:hypothetical protein [Halorientalis litorea]